MFIVTYDGKESMKQDTMEQVEFELTRQFGDNAHPTLREYNFVFHNELFFKMPDNGDTRLVSIYEVDAAKPVYRLVVYGDWVTRISNDFQFVLQQARRFAHRKSLLSLAFTIHDDAGVTLVLSK